MRATRSILCTVAALLLGSYLCGIAGCSPQGGDQRSPSDREHILAEVDTVMSELGGLPTANLDRGQRWRMVSSIGSGLPPMNFGVKDLPEPEARGAQLLEAYCVQCHHIPAPQMHSAAEWPILMRRMMMRAHTLHDRMGGPMTEGLLGQYLLSGMASAQIPSAEDVDSLTAYLQRHAMPVADLEELRGEPDADLFAVRCGLCHEPPSPSAHSADEWPGVVARMRANMALMDVKPMADQDAARIVEFLQGLQ
jgi:cytochrome c5